MTQFESVYLLGTGSSLPNDPVGNDEMEDVLGRIAGEPSRARRTILRSNGIKSRHYAIDPETGLGNQSNAEMTAEAVRAMASDFGLDLDDVDCISCGTTTPDQLMPNHASMVHGELGNRTCEVVATSGACLCGLTALNYAAMSVASGGSQHAVATGSEVTSALMRAKSFPQGETPVEKLKENPIFAFGQDFLRWMLSDGAGAVWLSKRPRTDGLSLRLDWIENVSFANELQTCMYWGAEKQEDGSLAGWTQAASFEAALEAGMMNFTQDARMLGREVGQALITRGFGWAREKHPMEASEVDWFLPHLSSEYFREEVHDRLAEMDFEIPQERWFVNLSNKGNTGSASIYIMLDDLFRSGRLEPGQKILGLVPESARFSVGYVLLTVVGPGA